VTSWQPTGFLKDLLQPTDDTRPLLDIAYAAWVAKTRLERRSDPGSRNP